jgi:hypothetical protein
MSYTTHRSPFTRPVRLLFALALALAPILGLASTPAQAALSWHIQTVDSAGLVGQESAITLDRSSRPVISYFDRTNYALKLVHCGDATCSSGNSFVTVDNNGQVGVGSSLTLDSNDRPVISYYDISNGHLKLAHCADANCTSDTSIITVDSSGDVGRQSSLVLDSSGRPVIGYFDAGNSALKLAHCADANCTSGTSIVAVDSSGDVGSEPALTLDSVGKPVISYLDTTNTADISLKLAHCGDANCANGNSITVAIESRGSLIGNTLAINLAGNPVMVIVDLTAGSLLLRICDDPNCATIAAPYDLDSVGHFPSDVSFLLAAGSFPLISYYDGSSDDLKVLQCDNVTCAGNISVVIDHVQSNLVFPPSISLVSDGYPSISYWDGANDDLKLARLVEETTPTPSSTPTSTPTDTATPTNTPTNTPTPSSTPTNTPTPSSTPTNAPTDTATPMNTPTNTPTLSSTPTNTPTPSSTPTPVGSVFSGFSAPVDNPPTVNMATAGRTIPLKWRLTDANGNPIASLTSVTITSAAGGCSAGAPSDIIEEYAVSASGLQNLGNGYYQFNWKIDKSWNGCRTLKLDLGSGQVVTALFQFR